MSWCSVSRAQAPRILVVAAPDVPQELAEGVQRSLAAVGDIADSQGYLESARIKRLAPTSEAALTRIAPNVRARLVVALESARRKVHVTFRDGSSGAVVAEQSLSARGKASKLSPRSLKKLQSTAQRALRSGGSRAASARGSRDDDDDDSDSDVDEPDPAPRAAPQSKPRPVAPAQAPRETEPEQPEAEEVAQEETSPSSSDATSEGLVLRVTAAGGGGARRISVPSREGGRPLDTGFFLPALKLGLSAQSVVFGQLVLSAEVDFRISLGLHASQYLPTGEFADTQLSSQSITFGVAPGYRFGGPGSVDLRLFVGWTFRGLSSADDALLSANSHGLVLRPDVRIPLADGLLLFRLAPELMIVMDVGTRPRTIVSGLAQAGVGFGGEVSLDIRLFEPVYFGLEYREFHAMVSSAWNIDFQDMERFALVRLSLQF